MSEILKIKPYARLITMLGDQLIKNERIALAELIKNSYDADASWVKVSFLGFNDDFTINNNSRIVVEDDGCGMNEDIIRNHWLNPATPEKLKRKEKEETRTTSKGRILQGEKGIGRFAVFKLGKTIKITTRRQSQNEENKFIDEGEEEENIVIYDFSKYDENFLSENGEEKELYLEDLNVTYDKRLPKQLLRGIVTLGAVKKERKPYGTIIEISNLKTNWSENRIEELQNEVGKMQPIFSREDQTDFSVYIYKDQMVHPSQEVYKDKLRNCMEIKSVYKVRNGVYLEKEKSISFDLNGRNISLNFESPEISGLKLFREKFNSSEYQTDCGDFKFEFYIFDFDAESNTKYVLDKEEVKNIKQHRIYLYRDDIRVMPYGDPDDDWLKIDMTRGTIRSSEYLSNDQVVGCVYITQEGNPKLKDKTNREGLIDEGRSLDDFITVLQLILKYLRGVVYQKYLVDKKNRKQIDAVKKGRPFELIEDAKQQFKGDKKSLKFIDDFEKSYRTEHKALQDRITRTENLAAVGLSVETASHDVMMFLEKTIEQLDSSIRNLMLEGEVDKAVLLDQLTMIRGNISMVQTQMKDIQLLFPSTKTRTKKVNVSEIVDKVQRLYVRTFKQNRIDLNIIRNGSPLLVKTTDAVLLQVFINLFDNATYWLKESEYPRKIEILIDGDSNRVVFSDNGPGIKEESEGYIFEAFYSEKGEEGRGLGLYIARQLLDRYDYSIELASFSRDKRLSGANFVLEFVKKDK